MLWSVVLMMCCVAAYAEGDGGSTESTRHLAVTTAATNTTTTDVTTAGPTNATTTDATNAGATNATTTDATTAGTTNVTTTDATTAGATNVTTTDATTAGPTNATTTDATIAGATNATTAATIDPIDTTPSTPCRREDYRREETDLCYKFHAVGATWAGAEAACRAEGAALAVANSREEALLFVRLLKEHLRTGISNAKFKGAVALGFRYDGEKEMWVTLDGAPLADSGYAKWWPGWPLDEIRAPYGFMEHTGRLENYGERITTPFICEDSW